MNDAAAQRPATPLGRMVRLSTLLFLQHAILGCWLPVLQLRFQALGLSGAEMGWIYSTIAIASSCAPWLGGQLADRVWASERVLQLAHVFGGLLLWFVASATTFPTIITLIGLHAMIYMPTLAISNSIVFAHLARPEREFAFVRLWGTASWIVVAALLGLWLAQPAWLPGAAHAETGDAARLAAIISFLLVGYLCFIPATPPNRAAGGRSFAMLVALKMLREPATLVLVLTSLLASITMPFVYPVASLYFKSLGVSDAGIAPLLSLGQVGEVLAFVLLSFSLARFGLRITYLIGLLSFALRYIAWTIGEPFWAVAAVVPLHGVCYAFVLGLGQIYLDRRAPADARASAQSLHQIAAYGMGMVVGQWLAGLALDSFKTTSGAIDYAAVYTVPLVIAAIAFIIALVGFHPARRSTTPAPSR